MTTSIIYLEDVTVNFDGFKALSRLNFFMDRRELRVVIGPNGAGKTTLLDVVSGRVKPESGRVIFGDHTDLLPLRENEIAQLGIGRKGGSAVARREAVARDRDGDRAGSRAIAGGRAGRRHDRRGDRANG